MQRGVPVLIQPAAAVGLNWECEKASVFQKFVEVPGEKVFFSLSFAFPTVHICLLCQLSLPKS